MQCMMVFAKKNIEWNKCEKDDLMLIRYFFTAEMGKAGKNKGLTAPPKPVVAIGELQLCHHQKWPIKQRNLISTPVICTENRYCTILLYFILRSVLFDTSVPPVSTINCRLDSPCIRRCVPPYSYSIACVVLFL